MTETHHDPLACSLLPVVIHELNNATQLLTSLNTLLAMPNGEKFLTERAGDMSSVGEEVHDLGWLLAALASASGDDMLMTRRHEGGLQVMAEYARKAIRRDNRDTAKAELPLPKIACGSGSGWEAAWALGVFLWSAARDQGEVATAWTWSREETCWSFEVDHPVRTPEATRALLRARVPEATLLCAESTAQLQLPLNWLEV